MSTAAGAARTPFLYRACFFAGCALFALSCAAGLALAISGGALVPGPARLDPQAMALRHLASGDLRAAAREFRMLAAIDPADCPSFEALGDVLAREGDLAGSVRVALEHVAVHPYSASAHTSLGLAFQRAARLSDAYGSFSMAVRLNPREAVALASMGDIARQQGRLDEAVSLYERALPHAADGARVHNKLAIAHALAGRREQALRHFDEALRLDPSLTDARTNRGLLAGTSAASFAEPR
jgi:tetratricopeptide (TPR) repeat protein